MTRTKLHSYLTWPVQAAGIALAAVSLQAVATAQTSGSVDAHTHVISAENWKQSPMGAYGAIDGPVDADFIANMLDAASFDKAVLISGAYFFKDQERARHENEFTAAQVQTRPERFVGLCSVSATQPWALEELEHCVRKLGLKGLKLHLMADNMDLGNPEHLGAVAGLFAKGAELHPGLPVLIDFNWIDDAQTVKLIQLAMANPGIKIVLAHGLGHHYAELATIFMSEEVVPGMLKNLYIDVSVSLLQYPPDAPRFEDYIWHLRRLGTDRILFGSDYPAKSTAESLAGLEKMGFSAAEQEQILASNAAKVYGFD